MCWQDRVKSVTVTHLWEPRPYLGMPGRLAFHFSSLRAPGRRECLDHLVTISMPEEQEEQSGSACAEGKAEAFINDPLSYLRDTF